ncbi:ead/Ea22-like family protein [Escherichia coli]|uniref:ead/Ea22-like family protein n=2 Tax=Escherichia coli TaxID=562 RepID=UPI0022829F3E|nr:ead/Ea22-like family protein [Escherichia coli]MCZ0368891.1 ead/Ea22-like family protein [Escherichia coli]
MNKIDYQALREAAEKAGEDKWQAKKINGDFFVIRHGSYTRQHGYTSYQPIAEIDCKPVRDFVAKANPATVLALLDERERNQQYIKRRDQENEDIALTVGKLSVELEASENNLIDSECHVAELEEALRDKQALLEASEKRIAELRDWNAGLAQESLTYQQRVAELEVIKSAAEKLVRCKGRYHSEQNYRALAALFGVTVPDLPPLEAESVSQTYKLNELSGNSPVSPGGWISCSERMPNDAQWCVVDAADGYYVQCWSEGQGWLGDDISLRNCDVIRWMAIPEPPEQDGE